MTDIEPGERYRQYQSRADLDRVPSVYLSDLVTETPSFFHDDCGSFYTFGWCSEREMAFVLVLSEFGFEGKIVQQGIHVWSSFWVVFQDTTGTEVALVADVDNTFDRVDWQIAPGTPKTRWLSEWGSGQLVSWYNKKARSPVEVMSVKELTVGPNARQKIATLVERYLSSPNLE